MIRAEQISDEVVEAYLVAERKLKPLGECLAAAINAWPDSILMPAELILPLPPEAGGDA